MTAIVPATSDANSPRFDLPETDAHSEHWWRSLGEGTLLLEHCTACGLRYFYPRGMCPGCWSDAVEWVSTTGRGRVYTYSVVRLNDLPPFAQRVPYVVAMIELDEGVRIMANLGGIDGVDIEIGMPVVLAPRSLDGRYSAPEFVPSSDSA